jgi:ADP-ribose pyrophosphatase
VADDSHLIERRLGSTTLLKGGFLEVRRDEVALPDGSRSSREYIRHSGAVAVIPLLDDGRCVLVRQYRYPVAKVLLEWPAGKLDGGESQVACAMRELQEETGYTAREWAYGGEIHNAPAYSDESIWLWFARGLIPGATRLDEGEFVETVLMTAEAVDALSIAGQLPDVKTQIGLNWLMQARRGERRLDWLSAGDAAAL